MLRDMVEPWFQQRMVADRRTVIILVGEIRMCYAYPGPRCTKHAKNALQAAVALGDTTKIKKAKHNYYLTPGGIKELRAAGKNELADAMLEKRKKMVQEYKHAIDNMRYVKRQMQEFEGHPYYDITLKQINLYRRKYGEPEVGRTRAVFDRGDGYVVKVPINGESFAANSREARTSEADNPYTPVAECYHDTVYDVDPDGVSVLVMEKLNFEGVPRSYRDLPDWVGSVDCGQVGYNRKGELVAYDL